jgi:hypothetical protein
MQLRTTLDGNFHTGHFIKNSDPNDIPLCDGQAQFPPDGEYREYLKSVPLTKEVIFLNKLRIQADFLTHH